MVGHAAMVLLFALNLELTPVLLNAPLLGYHGYLYGIPFLPNIRTFCVWKSLVPHKFEKLSYFSSGPRTIVYGRFVQKSEMRWLTSSFSLAAITFDIDDWLVPVQAGQQHMAL
jgi:hypothetical protein